MKDSKRGFVPSDEREFGDKAIPNLRQAADEVLFLLNHGYPVKGATRFVGDHYMFSEVSAWLWLEQFHPRNR